MSELPAGWELRYDPSGKVYYFDQYTKKTTWTDPRGGDSKPKPAGLNFSEDSSDSSFSDIQVDESISLDAFLAKGPRQVFDPFKGSPSVSPTATRRAESPAIQVEEVKQEKPTRTKEEKERERAEKREKRSSRQVAASTFSPEVSLKSTSTDKKEKKKKKEKKSELRDSKESKEEKLSLATPTEEKKKKKSEKNGEVKPEELLANYVQTQQRQTQEFMTAQWKAMQEFQLKQSEELQKFVREIMRKKQ